MTPDRRSFLIAGGAAVAASLTTAASAADPAPDRARKFVAAHEAKVKPLEIAAGIAWWDANISGQDEDFKRKEDSQNKIDAALSDRAAFAELKELKAAKDEDELHDKVLAREIEGRYLQYLEQQVDREL